MRPAEQECEADTDAAVRFAGSIDGGQVDLEYTPLSVDTRCPTCGESVGFSLHFCTPKPPAPLGDVVAQHGRDIAALKADNEWFRCVLQRLLNNCVDDYGNEVGA